MNKIINGEALEQLKKLRADSIDMICTDPPYGYSFMGKDWDKAVPSVELWAECLRVLKPGAFAFVMSAPRSDVQMHMIENLSKAGFRMDFTPIYWTYASGFPKAGNIGKLVDKRLGVERVKVPDPEAGRRNKSTTKFSGVYGDIKDQTDFVSKGSSPLEGSYAGFQPKPAVEVILVAMKPLSEKTYVDQAMKNGKGVTWLDDARIPFERDFEPKVRNNKEIYGRSSYLKSKTKGFPEGNTENMKGRFPANLLVSDDVLNDGETRKSGKGNTFVGQGGNREEHYYGANTVRSVFGDSGSYSRYFDIDKWWSERIKDLPESVRKTFPFLIVPKAGKAEKNKGVEHLEEKSKEIIRQNKTNPDNSLKTGSGNERTTMFKNHHPTVKPLKLMSYLVTLGSRPGDTVLDPFVGSGTTCIAAQQLNREYLGIELEKEYVKIAEARLKASDKQQKLI